MGLDGGDLPGDFHRARALARLGIEHSGDQLKPGSGCFTGGVGRDLALRQFSNRIDPAQIPERMNSLDKFSRQ